MQVDSTHNPFMDHFDPALISVVMPCYNGAPYMEAAIGSVLGQSYPQVELIVIDDGSTDGSTEILQRLAADHPERITLVNQSRVGHFAARNAALSHAHRNHVAFLDADDARRPDAPRQMHDALAANHADVAYCDWQNVGVAATDLNLKFRRFSTRTRPSASSWNTSRGRSKACRSGANSSMNFTDSPSVCPPPWTTTSG